MKQDITHDAVSFYIEKNQGKAGEAGAIEVILNAMEIHINNAKVCEYGCEALWNITLDGKKKRRGE